MGMSQNEVPFSWFKILIVIKGGKGHLILRHPHMCHVGVGVGVRPAQQAPAHRYRPSSPSSSALCCGQCGSENIRCAALGNKVWIIIIN